MPAGARHLQTRLPASCAFSHPSLEAEKCPQEQTGCAVNEPVQHSWGRRSQGLGSIIAPDFLLLSFLPSLQRLILRRFSPVQVERLSKQTAGSAQGPYLLRSQGTTGCVGGLGMERWIGRSVFSPGTEHTHWAKLPAVPLPPGPELW